MFFRIASFIVFLFFITPALSGPIDSLLIIIDDSNEHERFDLWTQVGLHYREAGNFDSANIAFHQAEKYIINKDQKGNYLHNLGSLNWRFGKYEKAEQWYDSAITIREKLHDTAGVMKSRYYLTLVYRDLSQYDKAANLTRSLIQLSLAKNDSASLADMYNHLGGIFLRLNQYDSASSWYKKAIDIRFEMKDSVKMADSYSNMGKIAREQSLYSEAVDYYKQALEIYSAIGKHKKEAYTRLLLGGTYWAAKKYQEALRQYLTSQQLYERMRNKQQVASTLKNIGLIYRDIGNIDKAVEYHIRSLELYRAIDNKPMIGIAINILAGDYWSAGNYNQALDTYLKALAVRKELGNKSHIAGSYNNVALAYKSLDKTDSALVNYRRAMDIYTKINDQRNVAAMLNNIGNLYKKNEQWDSAGVYLQKALKMRESIGHQQGIGYSALNLAQVLKKQKRLTRSLKLLTKAEQVGRGLKDQYLIQESCLLLSEIHDKLGNHEKAFSYYREYHEAERKLQVDESIRRVADMQIRFEAEKRKRIVEKKDAELKQQAMRIYFLTGGLLLLVFLIIVVIIAFIQKRRSNKLLAIRNHEIKEQNAEIEAQRDLAEQQRDKISEQNEKIKDSILYARRIQNALLPPDDQMEKLLKQHFILFKPRDVVSGDFYYFQQYKEFTVIAAADCTGHGVPGAFMSMLGISVLNEIMATGEFKDAAGILEILRKKVKKNLHQTSVKDSNSDGMDLALVILDRKKMKLDFAGANNPLVIVRDNQIITIEGDRMPIGVHIYDEEDFKNHEVKLEKADKIYMFSDGFVDQFGGKKGRKLMSKNFKNLLLETSKYDMKEQKEKLDKFFVKWKDDYRQIDDVVVMGLEI
ncbi:tetratricopeptide repeat protein [Salinivirga cyanobacteriivorans]